MQNLINSWVRDCLCKRPMKHDEKRQTKKMRIISLCIMGALLLLVLSCFVGCKTVTPTLPTNTAQRDSVRIEYRHDSIYTDRWHTEYTKGDTIYIRDSVWRDRWHFKHDSIYYASVDTIYQQITVEKKGSMFLRNSGIALWVLIGLAVIAAIIGIVLKFAK